MGLNVEGIIKSRKYKIDIRDVRNLELDINEIMRYLSEFKEKNNITDNTELFNKYQQEFKKEFEKYQEISATLIEAILQRKSIEYFKKHNDAFIREYDKVKKKDIEDLKEEQKFSGLVYKKEAFQKKVVKNLIVLFRQLLEEGVEEVVKVENPYMPSGYEECTVKTRLDKEKIKSEQEMILLIINNSIDKIDELQKTESVELLENISGFFKKYNIFEKMLKNHKNALKNMCATELSYELKGNSSNKGIEEIFEKGNLDKFSKDEIIGFNMFWQNKYAKNFKGICIANFAISQLDLLNNRNIELNDNLLKEIIAKYDLINMILIDTFNEKTSEFKKPHINRDVKSDYYNYYKSIFPNKSNNFEIECEEIQDNFASLKYIYEIKRSLICNQVGELLKNKKIKNWGYIEEVNGEMDSNYMLIGIDLDGYNMPIRVHVSKEKLIENLVETESQSIIPIYEGAEDFVLRREVIPVNVLLPLQKKHKEYLRKVKPISINKDFLEHVTFLSNSDKFPEHLKEEVNGKKIRQRKYINIVNGKKYTMEGNQYIELRKR